MALYQLSPYAHFVENRLLPNTIQYGIFHQLTGYVIEPRESVRAMLFAVRLGSGLSLADEDLEKLAADGAQIRELIEQRFLISSDEDPLAAFLDHIVVRPVQNPALVYRHESGEIKLVRTSMSRRTYSPRRNELPAIVEEPMPPIAANIFLQADGSRALREIFADSGIVNPSDEVRCRETIEFLTGPERQLIKLTTRAEDQTDIYEPCNTVPRNLYHAAKWNQPESDSNAQSISDFHLHGIDDATWEFDLIEPTINHAFRFPNEALGGFDYGARFCASMLRRELLPREADSLNVLEVGGGSGSFARSFIQQLQCLTTPVGSPLELLYHIADLSPALIQGQRETLAAVGLQVTHFHQDATKLDLRGHTFDLIVANEVIADFPVAWVKRKREGRDDSGQRWEGEGARDVEQYNLADENSPDMFLVNAGTFRFIERSWDHLSPGGVLMVSEYGAADSYPMQSYHLNHEEFSIHFGHVARCARSVGFDCQWLTLGEFLEVDDGVSMLDGHEEHIQCLNYVFQKHGMSLPYALISKNDFLKKFGDLVERIGLTGFSFSPLHSGFHYGPKLRDFMILIMTRPR
ncbi:MAG: hypothetical protein JWM21_1794 [Acidobacteria bacterium]|nr:hypothetical protein [Acidobacteriota bacterium]